MSVSLVFSVPPPPPINNNPFSSSSKPLSAEPTNYIRITSSLSACSRSSFLTHLIQDHELRRNSKPLQQDGNIVVDLFSSSSSSPTSLVREWECSEVVSYPTLQLLFHRILREKRIVHQQNQHNHTTSPPPLALDMVLCPLVEQCIECVRRLRKTQAETQQARDELEKKRSFVVFSFHATFSFSDLFFFH